MRKILPLAMVAALAADGPAQAELVSGRALEWASGWFHHGFRHNGQRLEEIRSELDGLPELAGSPFASRYGFRSETLEDPDEPHWLQIDLQRELRIDRIVAMPVHIPSLGEIGRGYGFPRRFKIEVGDTPGMENALMVVDYTSADFPNPGRYPADFSFAPVSGRYVRFTATRHFALDEGYMWGLEELLVLSGNESLAAWQPVTASSSLERYPNWSRWRVQDSQSALGLPESAERSSNRGHLSATTPDPDERKWLRVDLGVEREIDEIRLVPVRMEGFEILGEGAFPRGWIVELSNDAEFEEASWQYRSPPTNLVGYPAGSAVVMRVPAVRARYLRLVTEKLWGTEDQCGFGLAEFQAYAGGENVALGQPVAASDQARDGDPDWSPAFVTNGFSSRHRLIELPEYLDLIGLRGRLESEREELLGIRTRQLRATSLALGYGGGTLGGLGLIGCAWLLGRQRAIRRRAVNRLREQIARDLHDDIGTNLGGIVLLSEIGNRHSADPRAREDFQTIREAAEQTSQSMQDIVWLIEHGNIRLRDLIARLRQAVALILGDTEVTMTIEPADFRDRRLPLLFRRHFLFAFKEVLHNIRRHAQADTVDVRISVDGRKLRFEVHDDGAGFDAESSSTAGHGLSNLRRRAMRLQGSCHVESRPGAGTRVIFEANMRSRK